MQFTIILFTLFLEVVGVEVSLAWTAKIFDDLLFSLTDSSDTWQTQMMVNIRRSWILQAQLYTELVCCSKLWGGLRLKRFEDINLVLLCKLGWALAAEYEKLWTQAVKAKYFSNTKFFNCKKKTSDSWRWKGILGIKHIIKKILLWRIGHDDSINYWEEPWIPLNPLFLPTPKSSSCLENCGMVNSLFVSVGRWNEDLLEELFDDNSIKNIKKIPWFGGDSKDTAIWQFDQKP